MRWRSVNKLYLLALGFAIAAGLYAVNYWFSADLRAVQSGEVTLVCVMKDEARTISPNQVTGLMDGVWLFENGHARNCEVIKGGDL